MDFSYAGERPLSRGLGAATPEVELPACNFEVGDNVVYPHHGAGVVVKKETKDLLGENRDYLTIQILHNSMTVMVPCESVDTAGLRRVIDGGQVKKVVGVLTGEVSEESKSWTVRFKRNREKIKTGDVYELAEVVRNLAIRESEKGLSAGEKQMYARAKKILASEFMYASTRTRTAPSPIWTSCLRRASAPGLRPRNCRDRGRNRVGRFSRVRVTGPPRRRGRRQLLDRG
jgi:CarD family transcriptional regulator